MYLKVRRNRKNKERDPTITPKEKGGETQDREELDANCGQKDQGLLTFRAKHFARRIRWKGKPKRNGLYRWVFSLRNPSVEICLGEKKKGEKNGRTFLEITVLGAALAKK